MCGWTRVASSLSPLLWTRVDVFFHLCFNLSGAHQGAPGGLPTRCLFWHFPRMLSRLAVSSVLVQQGPWPGFGACPLWRVGPFLGAVSPCLKSHDDTARPPAPRGAAERWELGLSLPPPFQKPSRHKKQHKKKGEKEVRAEDRKRPKRRRRPSPGPAAPVENGALDEEEPLPVRGASLTSLPGPRLAELSHRVVWGAPGVWARAIWALGAPLVPRLVLVFPGHVAAVSRPCSASRWHLGAHSPVLKCPLFTAHVQLLPPG